MNRFKFPLLISSLPLAPLLFWVRLALRQNPMLIAPWRLLKARKRRGRPLLRRFQTPTKRRRSPK